MKKVFIMLTFISLILLSSLSTISMAKKPEINKDYNIIGAITDYDAIWIDVEIKKSIYTLSYPYSYYMYNLTYCEYNKKGRISETYFCSSNWRMYGNITKKMSMNMLKYYLTKDIDTIYNYELPRAKNKEIIDISNKLK